MRRAVESRGRQRTQSVGPVARQKRRPCTARIDITHGATADNSRARPRRRQRGIPEGPRATPRRAETTPRSSAFCGRTFPRIVDAAMVAHIESEVASAMRRLPDASIDTHKEDSMGLLRSVHEDTTPVHPKDDPDVQGERARGRSGPRGPQRHRASAPATLEAERDATTMNCTCCSPRRKSRGFGARYIDARVALAQRSGATMPRFRTAQGPWQQQAKAIYREAAARWLTWLEDEALAMNNAMLAAQEAAEQAGVRVEPLHHCPHLFPDAVAHRCKVGRAGLG